MKHLFIGGILSGKSINVPNTNTYRNVVRQAQPPDIPPIEEVYHKTEYKAPNVFSIFLHCSIKPDHIVKLLKLSHGQEEA